MTRFGLITLLVTMFSAVIPLHAVAQVPIGLEQIYRLDLLPQRKASTSIGSISSYDRTGGNDDGFSGKYSYVAKEADGLVIADLKGPGVIYRIWTPTPTDDLVEFYFDGEKDPRIRVKFRELFTGEQAPFVAPLVGYGAGGFYSYVPLPYRESCKIMVRAERVQFYQINFAEYPEQIPLQTWQTPPSDEYLEHQNRAATLLAATGSDITPYVVSPGTKTETHRVNVSLKPSETATLFETAAPGRIAALRMGPATALAGKERDLLLRIHWDDEPGPAVLCPAGDFFGYAWGQPAMKSLLIGTDGGTNYCYFPMPFDRSAKIELISTRSDGPAVDVWAEVVTAPQGRQDQEGKFYARWHRENPTTKGVPFTFVELEGRGHLVGCILQAQGFVSGQTPFFEGDDQTTIDGELVIHGTGSEDFFNGGWYDVPDRWEKRLSFPFSGCLGYQKHLGRTGGYRLMVSDAYAFEQGIRQTIEHAPTGNDLETDHCGIAFLYLEHPPADIPTIESLGDRQVKDLRRILFTPAWSVPIYAFTFRGATLEKKEEEQNGQRLSFLSMRAERGEDWFGVPFLTLVCDAPASGRYEVSIETVKGPAQAQVQLSRNEVPVGDPVELYSAERIRSEPISLGQVDLDEGPVNLTFKLVGKHEQSSGYGFDLITVQLERVD